MIGRTSNYGFPSLAMQISVMGIDEGGYSGCILWQYLISRNFG